MTIVVGQIEPLKKLKGILNENGITRFNSISEINDFIKDYESERNAIPSVNEASLNDEINELQSTLSEYQKIYDNSKEQVFNEINQKIKELDEKLRKYYEKSNKNTLYKILYYISIRLLSRKKSCLENNSVKITHKKTRNEEHEVTKINNKLDDYKNNREKIISARCDKSYKEVDYTKQVVDGLYTLIAGAIGENSVVNELKKLPDNYYLINDFSVSFNPPIYNKKENDRIFSIQVDHLLISPAGVFIIETKNWSKQSIKNLDFRSPVEQILRTSFALFVLLNGKSNIRLSRHHWGKKKIPIRNIIVMTNEKPKEEFKHVKVLSLDKLNGYVRYFDTIFSEAETENIFKYLR